MQHHEGGYYIRLLARDRPGTAATIARRLAQQQISLESIVQRHGGEPRGAADPGRSGGPVPVIMITYATSEDAVRKALAAVRRDRVVSGRPQVIRIEKNWRAGRSSAREWSRSCQRRDRSRKERSLDTGTQSRRSEIVRVTERAAVAAARLRGRGAEKGSDQAAVDAMRRELDKLPIDGTVVIGEGEMDEAPMLFIGEQVGTKAGPKVDIAVDPLEGTTLCAKNMPERHRDRRHGRGRHAAARARRLHGQDRDRPRLSGGRGRSRRAGRRKHPRSGQGQGRDAGGDHRHAFSIARATPT